MSLDSKKKRKSKTSTNGEKGQKHKDIITLFICPLTLKPQILLLVVVSNNSLKIIPNCSNKIDSVFVKIQHKP